MSDEREREEETEKKSGGSNNLLIGILIIILILLVGAIMFFVFRGNNGNGGAPTAAPTTNIPTGGSAWERIQASGILTIGTSTEYPPFEYYTQEFQLDGLDIAIIKEIAQRLGLQAEIKDMAFEGLDEALRLSQIDVAIAAISITDEREALHDFSNVYFVSEDAGLVRSDFYLQSITSVDQLVNLRIGVERGTVYDQWIQVNLIETGMMPESNLLRYEKAEHAVRDLQQNRNDVVALDLQPAQTAASELGLTIAWQGLAPQRLAIGLGQGEAELQAQINNSLLELQNSGRLDELVREYTGNDNVIPVPTPEPEKPTATPPPTPETCINGMAFINDLNLDDEDMTNPQSIPAGVNFSKGWRLQNTGTCTWTTDYKFVYVGGNNTLARMGGEPTAVKAQVSSGQTYDMWVNLTAPLVPGTYQGFWQMVDENNIAFGERVWVGIIVPGAPTPTPLPTQTPAPGINFSVDRDHIKQEECVTFSWNVTNAQTQYFYVRGQNWWEHEVPPQAQSAQCPSHTSDYELRVLLNNGAVEIRRITVYVEPNTQAPNIRRFTVNPQQINVNQCVNISWEVTGNINNVQLFRDNTELWSDAPHANSYTDCPPGQNNVQYRLEATGNGGTSKATQNVSLTVPNTPVPTPTATIPPSTATPVPTQVPPPTINNFDVAPKQIKPNECVSISWSAGGGTNYVQIAKGGAIILDGAPLSGNMPDCSNDEPGTVNYQMVVRNSTGQSDTRQQAITIVQPDVPTPAPPPIIGNWTIDTYRDANGNETAVVTNSPVPAAISFMANGDLQVSGGCNSFGGSYTVNNDQISVTVGPGTTISCGDAVDQQEQAILQAVSGSTRWAVPADVANQLTLSDDTGPTIKGARLVPTPLN